MATEAQIERLINAVEGVSMEISDNSSHSMSVDDYNLVSSVWEALEEISKTLKRIEEKM
jgi:hypothetical protein